MLDPTLKNLFIYTVKLFDIQYGYSQRGPEHRHISLTMELLSKVFLWYFEISRNYMLYSIVEMLDFTLKNLFIYFVKMFDIQYGYSQRGPEHRHISLTMELLSKVFLWYFEISRNEPI